MVNRFTKKAEMVIAGAKKCAQELGHSYIGSEHLLLGILSNDCLGCKILEEKKISYKDVHSKVCDISGVGELSDDEVCDFTPKCKRIIEASSACAKRFGSRFIGSEHILYSLCEQGESLGGKILASLGINLQVLKNEVATFLDSYSSDEKPDKNVVPSSPTLSLYGNNLNTLAKEGKYDPLIGRENEVERLIQILSRRTKNNPCLIGEPGVGKTAIIEGLAKKIIDGEVPENLNDKIIVSLNISSMIAGAKYRGEFEERMRSVMNELKNNDSLILFIDEIHTIVGAGAAEGAVDAANIIKPMLARGQIQLIGATTIEEYRKHIEKDAALERRFQPVVINEPSEDGTLKILFGLKEKYEVFHGVKIADEAIYSAVSLSKRYITDRFLPDKAIDLLDEACSRVKMKHFSKTPKIRELEMEIKGLKKAKEEAILSQNFELASEIRDNEIEKKILLGKENSKKDNALKDRLLVSERDIKEIVTLWSGIPISNLEKSESERLSELEKSLSLEIIGQREAIEAVCSSIRRGRTGFKNPNRPIGSFLFLGPTGVGKTYLAKCIAKTVFSSQDSLIRLDMSEYMEKHSISRLIGSPPGYVGYDEGGQLTKRVRLRPYSVVLFDEIEKAHPDIYNILLQILEDGVLTDSQGRVVDFKNTIMILTSNIGAKNITEPKNLGFSYGQSAQGEYENMKKKINSALKTHFQPEFLNRLDEIIIFNKLSLDDTRKIASIMLNEVKELSQKLGIELSFDKSAIDFLADKSYDKVYGARPLRRVITSYIENALSYKYLKEEIKKGDNVSVFCENDELVFKVK